MSFLSDLFHGNMGNLGNDLNPSNIFSDAATDFSKQPGWAKDLEIAAPLALGTFLTAGADLPALAGAGGLFGGLGAAGGAADAGAALGFAGDVGADVGAGAGGGALGAIDSALGAGAGGALPGDALALAAPDAAAAAPSAAGAAWPAALDLGGASAADVGGSAAGAPLALSGSAGAAAGGAGGAAPGGFLSSIAGGLKTAAPFIGAAGLGLNLFQGYEQKQQLNALNKQETADAQQAANTAATENAAASPLLTQGSTLLSYLTTNTLPPQFQTQVDQTIASQKAAIIQGYASRGMSTNPQQNSQLTQDLANVDSQGMTLKANLEQTLQTAGNQMIQTANQLLSSGLSATQLSAEIPIQISQLNSQLNQQMIQAISGFAAAINGGQSGKNITLSLGGGGGAAA